VNTSCHPSDGTALNGFANGKSNSVMKAARVIWRVFMVFACRGLAGGRFAYFYGLFAAFWWEG
jgi:hypothetical protein